MHFRKMLICVLTGLLCLGIFCPKAADAAQTPQEFVGVAPAKPDTPSFAMNG
jgi:hypothetical protein